jgi:hypothetical protein
MENLITNINEYSDKELEDMFDLVYPYQHQDILLKKGELYEKVQTDMSIDRNTKDKITNFLDIVSNRLTSIITKGITNSRIKPPDSFSQMTNYVENVNNTHFIIKNKQRQQEAYSANSSDGLNVGSDGGAPPGIINPINHTTIKRALNIDSRFRPDYYKTSSSDQRITLPYKFENVINMRLASVEIPLTFYTICKSYGNNNFVVEWNPDSSGNYNNAVKVQIPDGNYTTMYNGTLGASSIEAVINAEIQNPSQIVLKGGKTIFADPSFNLIYTVDQISGRSIFAVDSTGYPVDSSGVPLIDIVAVTASGYNSFKIVMATGPSGEYNVSEPLPFFLGWNLGYRLNVYKSGPGLVQGGSIVYFPPAIVSEGICYIKGPQYIFLAIDDYNNNVNNYYVSAYSNSINNKNILARINMSAITHRDGIYQTGDEDGFSTQINRSRNYFGPVDIEKLRITLYDEYGRIVNLNNMDWSCALMFECVYTS